MNPTNPQPVSAPVMPNPAPAIPPTPSGNKKMWLIGGGVIAIIVLAAIVWLMSSQKKTAPVPSSSISAEGSLDKELNTVNVEDIEADFQAVDTDLQGL